MFPTQPSSFSQRCSAGQLLEFAGDQVLRQASAARDADYGGYGLARTGQQTETAPPHSDEIRTRVVRVVPSDSLDAAILSVEIDCKEKEALHPVSGSERPSAREARLGHGQKSAEPADLPARLKGL